MRSTVGAKSTPMYLVATSSPRAAPVATAAPGRGRRIKASPASTAARVKNEALWSLPADSVSMGNTRWMDANRTAARAAPRYDNPSRRAMAATASSENRPNGICVHRAATSLSRNGTNSTQEAISPSTG